MQQINTYGSGAIANAGVPKTMSAHMPSVTLTANATTPSPQPTALTPQSMLQRLPSIIQPAPVDLAPPCDTFATWVSNNGLLVGVGMAVVAWLMWKEGHR